MVASDTAVEAIGSPSGMITIPKHDGFNATQLLRHVVVQL
jgi:hypothetical protein